jgi:hypothetical protein
MIKKIRDKIFSVRTTEGDFNRIIKKYGSFIPFLDLCLELDKKGMLRPLDRAIKKIDEDMRTERIRKALDVEVNNYKASNEWQDFEEASDSLDKKSEQLREK